ncbi:MAG TPA: RNA 2',3'-cyclic phosphodiesterase [Spirochaetota bacterium]|nr:RNA 2',3'-cyclic phosphodiesterase [Spirochaetota bacterium]
MDRFPKRMFIAMPVEAPEIDRVRTELEKSGRCLKVVHDDNYHITLKFLGDTGLDRCDGLVAALDSSSRPQKVECVIKGLGCFPGIADPSVIWAGMEYDSRLMEKLFLFAENAAVAAGFPPEQRRFTPHLTLARVRRESMVPAALKDYIKSSRETVYSQCVIDRVILFESVLKKNGPEYKVYKEWKLS